MVRDKRTLQKPRKPASVGLPVGVSGTVAPVGSGSASRSVTRTGVEAWTSAFAAPHPPQPPPTTTMCGTSEAVSTALATQRQRLGRERGSRRPGVRAPRAASWPCAVACMASSTRKAVTPRCACLGLPWLEVKWRKKRHRVREGHFVSWYATSRGRRASGPSRSPLASPAPALQPAPPAEAVLPVEARYEPLKRPCHNNRSSRAQEWRPLSHASAGRRRRMPCLRMSSASHESGSPDAASGRSRQLQKNVLLPAPWLARTLPRWTLGAPQTRTVSSGRPPTAAAAAARAAGRRPAARTGAAACARGTAATTPTWCAEFTMRTAPWLTWCAPASSPQSRDGACTRHISATRRWIGWCKRR